MEKKSLFIDMDDVLVIGRFQEFMDEFLGKIDYSKYDSYYKQDLLKEREAEFIEKYQFENIYKNKDGSFIDPLPDSIEVLKRLKEYYELYIVTAYVWKNNVIDAAHTLKYKFEYLEHFFPFIEPNNIIFSTHKTKMHFDVGIDDRPKNLGNCDIKLLFSETRNKKMSNEELAQQDLIRVDNWKEVEKVLRKKY